MKFGLTKTRHGSNTSSTSPSWPDSRIMTTMLRLGNGFFHSDIHDDKLSCATRQEPLKAWKISRRGGCCRQVNLLSQVGRSRGAGVAQL